MRVELDEYGLRLVKNCDAFELWCDKTLVYSRSDAKPKYIEAFLTYSESVRGFVVWQVPFWQYMLVCEGGDFALHDPYLRGKLTSCLPALPPAVASGKVCLPTAPWIDCPYCGEISESIPHSVALEQIAAFKAQLTLIEERISNGQNA